ncbi:hypothetical protein B0T21DRAFT_368886 [Apiosordaria backusii]|uniref:Uncharacterized protein n=1 Tax=Apiosordaria backusii TaxID=314023 RepID=A0AA40BDS2_9PEZI|nr:hypothetical protein B0T21DRAFT_368886 [Apiosordaria backusii]
MCSCSQVILAESRQAKTTKNDQDTKRGLADSALRTRSSIKPQQPRRLGSHRRPMSHAKARLFWQLLIATPTGPNKRLS